jgi:hypothetical protein
VAVAAESAILDSQQAVGVVVAAVAVAVVVPQVPRTAEQRLWCHYRSQEQHVEGSFRQQAVLWVWQVHYFE